MKAIRPERRNRVEELRTLLRARLRAAQKRNSRFSLRAFAKQLGVDHSTLSQLLRGKRRLTRRRAELFGQKLGLAADIVNEHASALERERRGPERRGLRSRAFDADTFAFVSQWQHVAILELTHLAGFRPDSRWIAAAIGIDVADVNIALQRLLRLRLLEMRDRATWIDKSGDVELVGVNIDDDARQRLLVESYRLATRAAERAPLERQLHDQMVLAVEKSRLPALQAVIERFMGEARAVASGAQPDAVYRIVVAIHPLSTDNAAASIATREADQE